MEGPCEKGTVKNKKFRSRWMLLEEGILKLFAKEEQKRQNGAEKESYNLAQLEELRKEDPPEENKVLVAIKVGDDRALLKIDMQWADGWLAIFATYYTVAKLDPGYFPIPVNIAEALWACINHLSENGYNEMDIFRIPGDSTKCNELQQYLLFEGSGHISWMYSPFDIATVCNRFLRQVPNQLFQNFDAWMAATAKYDKENPDPSIDSIKKLLESIHPMEKRLIRGLFALLKKISDNQDHTKMGISNLQTVFSAVLIPEEYSTDMSKIKQVTKAMGPIFEILITHQERCFLDPPQHFSIPIPPVLSTIACIPFFEKYAGIGARVYKCADPNPEQREIKISGLLSDLERESAQKDKIISERKTEMIRMRKENEHEVSRMKADQKKLKDDLDKKKKDLAKKALEMTKAQDKFSESSKKWRTKEKELKEKISSLEKEKDQASSTFKKEREKFDDDRKVFENERKEFEKERKKIKRERDQLAKEVKSQKKAVEAEKLKSNEQLEKFEEERKRFKQEASESKKKSSGDDQQAIAMNSGLQEQLKDSQQEVDRLKVTIKLLSDKQSQSQKDLFEMHTSELAKDNAELKQANSDLCEQKEALMEQLKELKKELAERNNENLDDATSRVRLKVGKVIDRLVLREDMGKSSAKVAMLLMDEYVVFSDVCNSRVYIEYPAEGWASLRDAKGYPLIQKIRRESMCPNAVQEFIQKRRKMGTKKRISISKITTKKR